MSVESWLTVTGYILTAVIFVVGIVVAVVGWLLSRMISRLERQVQELEESGFRLGIKIARLEVFVDGRGRLIKYSSPPPPSEETA